MKVTLFLALLSSLGSAQNNPAPFVNLPLTPTAVAPGGAGFTLTVTGTGFVAASAVQWNGHSRTTHFISSAKLTADISASDIAKAQTAVVTVATPAPGGGTSNTAYLQVIKPEATLQFSRIGYTTTVSPSQAVVTGDFNHDGRADMVLLDTGRIFVYLGKGDGTFNPPISTALSGNQATAVVGDFNHDGNLDLAIGQYQSLDGIVVLLGKGDGTFQKPAIYGIGHELALISVAVGDFNGDGNLDLAAVDEQTPANLSILLGNGDGTFQAHVDYPAPEDPSGLAVGDFNKDGKLDLIAADIGGASIYEYLGNGDGTFQPYVSYPAGLTGVAVAIADFNGDGNLDVALGNLFSNPAVSVLLGNGDGTFQPAALFDTANDAWGFALGDFNGDGRLDLAVGPLGQQISVLEGLGDGSFLPHLDFSTVNGFAEEMAVADFDGDGRLDLVTLGDSATVYLQKSIPVGSLQETSLTFGTTVVFTTSPAMDVIFTNTGLSTLHLKQFSITGDFLQTNTCGATLAPSVTCTINVTFTPTDRGTRTGTLSIKDDDFRSPQMIALSGTGINLSLTPASLDFGGLKIGSSRDRLVTVANVGHETVNFTSIAASDQLHEYSQTNSCGTSLAAGASCSAQVTFTPTVTGLDPGEFYIFSDAGGSYAAFVTLSGSGAN